MFSGFSRANSMSEIEPPAGTIENHILADNPEINQHWPVVVRERFGDGGARCFRIAGAHRLAAKGFGNLDEIRVARRQVGEGVLLLMEQLLPLAHHAG